MADRVVDVVHSGDGGASGALVAVVLLIAVLLLVLYFTGVFGRTQKKDINVDVNVNKPGVVLLVR
jgi:hypothetical protein